MTDRKFQHAFVELLKTSIPAHLNLAEELSSRMGMSLDSVYRRLRCETDFSLEETMRIAAQFNISISNLLANETHMVTFRANELNKEVNSFADYLKVLHIDMQWINSANNASITYAAEDLPIFYHFFFPELARFKMVYWNKSVLGSSLMQGKKVEDVNLPDAWLSELPKVKEAFLKIPSTEIWHEDTLKSTVKQIQFYWAAGFFNSKETLIKILNELSDLCDMVKKQAEVGKKYDPTNNKYYETEYTLYSCDIMIGNNCVYLKSDSKTASYLGYNTFNFIQTRNDYFNRQTEDWINNILAKSDLVSVVSERLRNQFFQNATSHIDRMKAQIH